MLKRISVLLLTLVLALSVGCGKNKDKLSVEKGDDAKNPTSSTEVDTQDNGVLNPLTGLKDLNPEDENLRPTAVMINNISQAQTVQTGLNEADIVYETEVEGGITRLLAVFKDIKNVKQLGTVRSARYCFIDLALGHDAMYVHHGQDAFHAQPHLKDVDAFTVSEKSGGGGARITNGLSREHTLYAYGDKLWEALGNRGYSLEASSNEPWQTFTDKADLSNTANSVSAKFSSSYITKFVYNPDTAKYTRYSGNTKRIDYVTEEKIEFKNVFVLKTTIRSYNCSGSDTYNHKEVLLDSGTGYYFSNGKYEEINWSKGSASNGFVFTKTDGTTLKVTAGNSWVCIMNKNNGITIE